MKTFKVAYTITRVEEEDIEAENFDEAKKKWEDIGYDAELFFIRDIETDEEIVFD